MTRRLNTVIFVPHSKARFLKFSFSTRAVVITGSALLIALTLSVFAITYTKSAVSRRAEVDRLNHENEQLTQTNEQLKQTMTDVQERLDEFEERTSRLALAAGIETEAFTESGNLTDPVGSGGPYDRLAGSRRVMAAQQQWIDRQLSLVEKGLIRRDQQYATTPTITPVMGVITSGYGRRWDPISGKRAIHEGLDISARRGQPVKATADGVVVFAARHGGFGKVVRISHGFGSTISIYGHLDRISVKPGDEVHRGQQIGLLGNTGRSTGPHLHYEIRVNDQPRNPLEYILDAF